MTRIRLGSGVLEDLERIAVWLRHHEVEHAQTRADEIVGALILTVMTTMLTLLQIPEGGRRILFGLIILAVTALFIRLTERN